jgi:hypothetical protein
LFHLIHQSQEQFSITLYTAIPEEPVESLATSYVQGRNRGLRELEIRVLTPAFYSRFVHYAHTSEAFDRECIFTDEMNRTLWISRPELLPLLLNRSVAADDQQPLVTRGYFDELRWNILKKLRCAPATPAYGSSSYNPALTTEDVRSLPYSEFDQYIRNLCPGAQAREYRRTVTKLFLAQRFSLGFTQSIGLLDLLVRLLLCYLGLSQLVVMRDQIAQADIGGCSTSMFRNGTVAVCLRDVREAHGEWWWWLIGAAITVSTNHLYGFLKGYN